MSIVQNKLMQLPHCKVNVINSQGEKTEWMYCFLMFFYILYEAIDLTEKIL
jgi:hypothetical protein